MPSMRDALGQALPARPKSYTTYTDTRTKAVVHRKHATIKAPPEPVNRPMRMGEPPRGPKSSMGVVCQELSLHNPRSACVAFTSYESRHYPY